MKKTDKLPKELRIDRSKRENRLYEKPITGTLPNKKNGVLVPIMMFIALSVILVVFFQGHLEVAIVVIAFIGLALLARWFFNR